MGLLKNFGRSNSSKIKKIPQKKKMFERERERERRVRVKVKVKKKWYIYIHEK
jgi:hypothetical protein